MRRFLGILGCGILLLAGAFSLHSAIVNLSATKHVCEYPFVQPFGDKVMVVWSEKEGGAFNIFSRLYSGGRWGDRVRAFGSSLNSEYPNLAVDASGRIHMVWMEGTSRSNREIYHAVYASGRWSSPTRAHASKWNSCWPRVGVESGGTVSVVWCSELYPFNNSRYDIVNKRRISGWSGGVMSASSTPDSISIHPALAVRGNVSYACWMDGRETDWKILYSRSRDGYWQTPTVLSGGDSGWWPGIAVDSRGRVHVLFSTLRGAPYYTRQEEDGQWTRPAPVPGAGDHERDFIYVEADDQDVLHASWRQVFRGHLNIVYASASAKGEWTAPGYVSDGQECRTPVSRPDNRGYVHIVWWDEGVNNGDVFYSRVESGSGGTSYQSPVAVFTPDPVAGPPPLKVTFDATASQDEDGRIAAYTWDFGDGSTGGGAMTNHVYSQRGEFIASLTVTDDDGLTGSASTSIYVSDPPVARFSMNPETGVAPLRVRFDASASSDPDGTISKYVWDFGDNQNAQGRIVEHTYPEAGEYVITLEVADNFGISHITSRTLRVMRVYPPQNVSYVFRENRNLFSREYLYEVQWAENPLNQQYGIQVTRYKIYRRVKGGDFSLVETVGPQTFSWLDRYLAAEAEDQFEYQVSAVDDRGNESSPNLTAGGEFFRRKDPEKENPSGKRDS